MLSLAVGLLEMNFLYRKKISEWLGSDSTGGILLIVATILALALANSPLAHSYTSLLHMHLSIQIGSVGLDKTLHHWINDGLMVIFFVLIGLEVKREIIEGHLSSVSKVALPAIAALGGMAVPALLYTLFNHGDATAMRGWAIPTATDIAFALGVLSLLGNRVPLSLKVFLMALAIIDDLGAIVVIALFYTTDISLVSIVVAALALTLLISFNRLKVTNQSLFYVVGIVLWLAVLESGVHATLAGVAFAFTIPLYSKHPDGSTFSPLKELEHGLHGWITFLILPLFAFVNAGVNLGGLSAEQMTQSVPVGIFLGLFLGKQIGVFAFSWLSIKLGLAPMPQGSNWMMLYGVSILTGIGFTMSLFIDSLAFVDDTLFASTDKLAILLATLFASVFGYLVLHLAFGKKESGCK